MPSTMVSFYSICKSVLLTMVRWTHVNWRTTIDHDQFTQFLMLVIQGEDPSVFVNGVCTLLVTNCFLLSEPGRELGQSFGRGLSPCRRKTSHSTCLMFLPSPCPCSFLCLSLCLCLCPSLCPCLCLCSYLCLSWARRLPLVWCRSRPLCTFDASLSTHFWELRTLAASSRSDQRASAILDLVGCVPVLLLWSCPEACLNSVPHTVAQVVPTPPRLDLCLPQTETAATPSASLGTVLCVAAPTLPDNVSRFRIHSLDRWVSWSSGVHDLTCASSAWTQAVSLVFSEARSYRPRASLATDSLPHSRVPGRVLHPPPRCTVASWMTNLSTRVFHPQTSRACFQLWDQPSLLCRLGQVHWKSCCSLRIDRRLLSHQLLLLMFDHCALLTQLRFQLLQPLRKFFHQIPATYQSTHGDSLVP